MVARWLSQRGALLLVVGGLLLASGCYGGRNVVVAYPGPNTSTIVVQNYSAVPICYIQFSPTSNRHWGPDRLGRSEVVHPGTQRVWHVVSDYYDLRMLDCRRRVLWEQRNLALAPGRNFPIPYR